MTYQGLIKKSRTLDAAAILGFINLVYPVLQANLPELLSARAMSIFNIAGAIVIAILRFDTKGPVGEK